MRISDWSSDVCSSDLLISNLGQTNLATLIIGVLSTAFLFWVRKGLKPLLIKAGLQSRPADLIAKAGPIAAVATATLAVVLLDLEERGVAIVGDIPQSLPPFTMPLFDAGLWQQLDRKSTRLNSSH